MGFQQFPCCFLGGIAGKQIIGTAWLVTRFYVAFPRAPSRSRWPTSWTRRSPARGRARGSRRGAGIVGHFEIPHRLANARRDPDTLKDRHERATFQAEGQPRSTQPRLTETPRASGPGPRTPALLIPAPEIERAVSARRIAAAQTASARGSAAADREASQPPEGQPPGQRPPAPQSVTGRPQIRPPAMPLEGTAGRGAERAAPRPQDSPSRQKGRRAAQKRRQQPLDRFAIPP